MLIQFGVENFGAIDKPQALSLVASNYYRDLDETVIDPKLPGLSGVRFLRAAVIYGPNASGKSTILKALSHLRMMVLHSAKKNPDVRLPCNPFLLGERRNDAPTGFFVVFTDEGIRYRYEVRYVPERVLHESLSAFPRGREQEWFVREWDAAKSRYDWRRSSTGFAVKNNLIEMVRDNALLVSVGAQFNHAQLGAVQRWFARSLEFYNLGHDSFVFDPNNLNPIFSAKLIMDSSPLRDRLLSLLRQADFGVADAQAKTVPIAPDVLEKMRRFLPADLVDKGERTNLEITLGHHGASGVVPIDWDRESAGTQRFFALAGPWLDILERGATAFIDELDTSLHPLLVKALLGTLLSPETNPSGAQIVFTTHNPFLLSERMLRRDQVWFTEKDGRGAAHLYPLSDYNPKPKESLINGYLSGRYGAVPMIPPGFGV